MCTSKPCLGVLTATVALLAVLITRPELLLPHKIHAAVSLKGWDGFSAVVAANVLQRTKGQRSTKSREAW
eukprot:COSAG03_NODE_1529_length_3930_cov_9.954842_2_plen_70_part_00